MTEIIIAIFFVFILIMIPRPNNEKPYPPRDRMSRLKDTAFDETARRRRCASNLPFTEQVRRQNRRPLPSTRGDQFKILCRDHIVHCSSEKKYWPLISSKKNPLLIASSFCIFGEKWITRISSSEKRLIQRAGCGTKQAACASDHASTSSTVISS